MPPKDTVTPAKVTDEVTPKVVITEVPAEKPEPLPAATLAEQAAGRAALKAQQAS